MHSRRVGSALDTRLPRRCDGVASAAITAGAIASAFAWWTLTRAQGFQPSADSHYHFTVARSLLLHGPWASPAVGLPFTVLADMPVDHYWGLHLCLTPFALLSDYALGLKLAAVAGFSLIFASLAAFFARRGVHHPVTWALLCGLFSNQDWRYLQLRGAQLLLPLMLLTIELLAFTDDSRKRRAFIVVTAWFGMLSYHGAILLLPIAVVTVGAAQAGVEHRSHWRKRTATAIRDISLTMLGLLLGLIVNPYADRRWSTFRFAFYHLTKMGRDSANLYADQPLAEFHGMPPSVLVWHPEWGVLFLATLGTLLWVLARRALGRAPARDVRVFCALAVLGGVFVSQAVRTREYAVPLAMIFLAVAWRDSMPTPRWYRAFPLLVACMALALKVPQTCRLARQHLPTLLYRGAHDLLVANGTHPVLNLAEADFGMLRIEYLDVVCVHALSRYFLLPNRSVYDDVWYLYRSPEQSQQLTEAALQRFYQRGVRLVATHGNRAFDRWAAAHTDRLEVVFRSPVAGARIYRILN